MLRAARDGATVADIAATLFLSEGTVRNHLSAAIGKTGLADPRRGGAGRRRQRLAAERGPPVRTVGARA